VASTRWQHSGRYRLNNPAQQNRQAARLAAVGRELIQRANASGIPLRLFGSVGVYVRCCDKVGALNPCAIGEIHLKRRYNDLDFASTRREAARVRGLFQGSGWKEEPGHALVTEDRRLLFTTKDTTGQIVHADVFNDSLTASHNINFVDRLLLQDYSLTPADLFLTKAQRVYPTTDDIADLLVLLKCFPLTSDDSGINLRYVVRCLSSDWGLERTVLLNLQKVQSFGREVGASVTQAIDTLRRAVTDEPKAWQWLVRSWFGPGFKWFARVEDPLGF